jgi:hemoglobin-like flavoprotein
MTISAELIKRCNEAHEKRQNAELNAAEADAAWRHDPLDVDRINDVSRARLVVQVHEAEYQVCRHDLLAAVPGKIV